MARMKDIRSFIAEEIMNEMPLVDIDAAYVMADELWDEAVREHDLRALRKLNNYVRAWKKELV